MKAEIKYHTDEFTSQTEQFATMDAIANISSLLTNNGFIYGRQEDFWLEEIQYTKNGRQVLTFRFSNPQKAMIERLRGL